MQWKELISGSKYSHVTVKKGIEVILPRCIYILGGMPCNLTDIIYVRSISICLKRYRKDSRSIRIGSLVSGLRGILT